MANTLLTPNIIAREVLFMAVNTMVLAPLVNRRYSGEFNKVGDTIRVRKPNRFYVVNGPDITSSIQPVDEQSVNVTINQNPVVPFEFEDKEMALTVDDFRERYIVPASNALANFGDSAIASLYSSVPNVVGIAGTTPANYDAVAAAAEMLDNCLAPRDSMRSLVINPKANRVLTTSFQAGFNPAALLSETFKNGLVNRASGFDIYMDQNIQSFKDFPIVGTLKVNGASQVGSTLNVILSNPGDKVATGAVIQFTNVNKVNSVSYADTGELQDFVVLQGGTSDGGGLLALTIYPPINLGPNNALATVTNSPDDASVITIATIGGVQATPKVGIQNLAFHRDAFGLVSANLRIPKGMDVAEVVSYKGFTMRFVRGFDILTGQFISRIEMLFGVCTFYADMATRVLG